MSKEPQPNPNSDALPPSPQSSPSPAPRRFRGSGGTEGGVGMFFGGLLLAGIALWLFLDSVQVGTGGWGFVSGMLGRLHAGGVWQTTSMGVIFLPFFLGVLCLFYDSRQTWAWYLTYFGIAVIVVEILSRVQFVMSMKTTHLLLLIACFAAGTGLMLRSYKDVSGSSDESGEGKSAGEK